MGVRRQAREAALQALFQCDFVNEWNIEAVQFCFDYFSIPRSAQSFGLKLCQGVIDNLVQIDSRLTCASENWSLSRMGRVDRSILRLATYEIAFLEEVPINVAINEAIEIAKRFGADESPVFVNGVLDKVASTVRSELQGSIEVEVVRPEAAQEEILLAALDEPLAVVEESAPELAKELLES